MKNSSPAPFPFPFLTSLKKTLPTFSTSLLRYDPHTIPSSHLKCTIQWLSVRSRTCASITTVNLRVFSFQKNHKTPHPYRLAINAISPSPALGDHQSTFCPQICLFGTFHPTVTATTQHAAFCDWPRSHDIVFSRVTHVAAHMGTSCPLLPDDIALCAHPASYSPLRRPTSRRAAPTFRPS